MRKREPINSAVDDETVAIRVVVWVLNFAQTEGLIRGFAAVGSLSTRPPYPARAGYASGTPLVRVVPQAAEWTSEACKKVLVRGQKL